MAVPMSSFLRNFLGAIAHTHTHHELHCPDRGLRVVLHEDLPPRLETVAPFDGALYDIRGSVEHSTSEVVLDVVVVAFPAPFLELALDVIEARLGHLFGCPSHYPPLSWGAQRD